MTEEMTTAEKRAAALAKAREVKAANKAAAAVDIDDHVQGEDALPEMAPAPAPLAAAPHTPTPKVQPADAMPKVATPTQVLEVELMKDYVPKYIEDDMGELVEQGEIKTKIPRGTVVKLPVAEATRAMRLQIAIPTAGSFNEVGADE